MVAPRKFAEIRDRDTGQTLVEVFGPGRSSNAVSHGLRILTHQLILRVPESTQGGGVFGGAFGYGVEFENDAFLMHPYCWCERADCLWCSGCACNEAPYEVGHYLDGQRVSVAAYDAWHATIQKPMPWEATTAGNETAEYLEARRAFYAYVEERDRRSGRIWPAFIHTCGQPIFYSQRQEVWSVTRPRPHAEMAPHFWHKQSGMRVWWYKYIGRDQIVHVEQDTPLTTILDDCLLSIGAPSLVDAAKAYVEGEAVSARETRAAMAALERLVDWDQLLREPVKWADLFKDTNGGS